MKNILLIVFLLFAHSAWAKMALDAAVLSQITQFQENESERVQPEQSKLDKLRYAANISLAKDEGGKAIQTHHLFIIVHGLFESPEHIRTLHDFLFDQYKQNTVSLRLAGHFDKKIDMSKVTYQVWLRELREQIDLFSPLGEKIIFIGHSTGGLLATLLASENSAKTDALIVAAGAFENSLKSKLLTRVGSLINYDAWDEETGRRVVASLGYEVEELADFVAEQLRLVPERIAPVRVMTEDTAIDGTVDPKSAERFFGGFPEALKRSIYTIPEQEQVEHKDVPKSEPFKKDLRTFMHVYFGYQLGTS